MNQVEPRIVERFPTLRERILHECFQDATVAELCRDYDYLIAALEAAMLSNGAASQAREALSNSTRRRTPASMELHNLDTGFRRYDDKERHQRPPGDTCRELLQLAVDLEQELLDRLELEPGNGFTEVNPE